MFFRSESGQNMTAESDCHTSGPPPSLKMDLLQAMEDFVRAWLRSESTLFSNCIHTKGLVANSSHHFNFAFGMRYQTTAIWFELRYFNPGKNGPLGAPM
jgi:hypothetical protein